MERSRRAILPLREKVAYPVTDKIVYPKLTAFTGAITGVGMHGVGMHGLYSAGSEERMV